MVEGTPLLNSFSLMYTLDAGNMQQLEKALELGSPNFF